MILTEYDGGFVVNNSRASVAIPIQNFGFTEWLVGWGPGRWGGHVSTLVYSELYYEYGLAGLWGASPEHSTFLSDGFWPHVLGEVGGLGVVIISLTLLWVRNAILRCGNSDHRQGLMAIFYLLFIYSFFMSSFEVNIMLFPFAYLIALSVKCTGENLESWGDMSERTAIS